MFLSLKKIKLEHLAIFVIVVFAGLIISVYNLSVLFLIVSFLFIMASFKYFNQILFLLILYIPFQVALNITFGVDLASGRVLIIYFFVVWVLKSLAEKKFIIKFNLQTLLICLFLFIAVFSMLQTWDIERSFRKILVFLSIFPLYFIITSLSVFSLQKKRLGMVINKNNYIYKILDALVISGFVLSLIGILQFALQFFVGIDLIMNFWKEYISPIFYGKTFGAEVVSNPSWLVNIGGETILRAFSLFPDPHMFSFYLGLLIPIMLAIALCCDCLCHKHPTEKDKTCHSSKEDWKIRRNSVFQNNRILLYLVLFIMFLAELLTFSRGGYIGMIASIGITIILLWKYISLNKKIILGLIAGSFILFIMVSNQSILNRFLSSFDFNEGSNTERIKNWSQGWEVFNDNFFIGVGIGNYSAYLYPTAEYRTPIYAHNLYLDIGAEMGIFALFVWLALIGTTIWQLFRTGKKSKDVFLRALSFGLIGSLIWFSLHSFFDTAIYSPTILAIFVIIVSLSVMTIQALNIKCDDIDIA